MIKKTITYTDYNGNERTEDFWFHLSESELMRMELSKKDGLSKYLEDVVNAKDGETIFKIFEELVLKAYGEKSEDGRRFIKSDELSKSFTQTAAYDKLITELASNDKAAIEFVNGVVPAGFSQDA